MVDQELRTGLYITIPLYFFLLVCVSYWAYRRQDKMKHEGTNDALTTHYLAGRSFGPVIMSGTLFASLFSGYTVVGVPNEAFYTGWFSLRWMAGGISIGLGLMGTGPRMRKTSMVRNHQSPTDFITDRYQCQILRYTILFVQVVPSIIYLAAQVIAIKVRISEQCGVFFATLSRYSPCSS
jgi:Na+/proline symporter